MNSYENLAVAIVTRAVSDYKHAVNSNNPEVVKRLEKFFRSDYFSMLINLDGEDIMKIIRRKYA